MKRGNDQKNCTGFTIVASTRAIYLPRRLIPGSIDKKENHCQLSVIFLFKIVAPRREERLKDTGFKQPYLFRGAFSCRYYLLLYRRLLHNDIVHCRPVSQRKYKPVGACLSAGRNDDLNGLPTGCTSAGRLNCLVSGDAPVV